MLLANRRPELGPSGNTTRKGPCLVHPVLQRSKSFHDAIGASLVYCVSSTVPPAGASSVVFAPGTEVDAWPVDMAYSVFRLPASPPS